MLAEVTEKQGDLIALKQMYRVHKCKLGDVMFSCIFVCRKFPVLKRKLEDA